MLMHHADAGLDCGAWFARRQDFSKGTHLSTIGGIMPEKNIHQGRFARAVFAQQCQQFAFSKRQADVVIGNQLAEMLADMGQFQHGLTVHLSAPAMDAGKVHGSAASI